MICIIHFLSDNYTLDRNNNYSTTGRVRPKMSMYDGARSMDWLPTRTRTPTMTLLGLVLFTSRQNPPA